MQETEVKFYVRDLDRLRSHLVGLGAHPIQERGLEKNLRFDLPDRSLQRQGRVLRLRHDTQARLTYKSGSKNQEGILSREEIEFIVEDFEKARLFLEALGYQKLTYYEKYRTTYELNETHVMLDELPYGSFIEIEGETIPAIRLLATQLRLNWDAAIPTSYIALFERLRKALKLSFQDISFENFTGIEVDASHLGALAADG